MNVCVGTYVWINMCVYGYLCMHVYYMNVYVGTYIWINMYMAIYVGMFVYVYAICIVFANLFYVYI